jgi:hypothetical protein
MSPSFEANPFGSVLFSARVPVSANVQPPSVHSMNWQENAVYTRQESPVNPTPVRANVQASLMPDSMQLLSAALGIPTLAQYLGVGKKGGAFNPFQNTVESDLYPTDGEAESTDPDDTSLSNRWQRQSRFRPTAGNPFTQSLDVLY